MLTDSTATLRWSHSSATVRHQTYEYVNLVLVAPDLPDPLNTGFGLTRKGFVGDWKLRRPDGKCSKKTYSTLDLGQAALIDYARRRSSQIAEACDFPVLPDSEPTSNQDTTNEKETL